MVPRNSTPGGFAYIWQSKWEGIIAIKTEKTQIHFLSDVLVAVASLDLKFPPNEPRRQTDSEDPTSPPKKSVPKDVTSKILPYDIMHLFINGVPWDLDRQKQQLYARAAHLFQHLFADYAYDEKTPNFTFYGGQHRTTTDGSPPTLNKVSELE